MKIVRVRYRTKKETIEHLFLRTVLGLKLIFIENSYLDERLNKIISEEEIDVT